MIHKPRYLDYNLNTKIVNEIEEKLKQLKNRETGFLVKTQWVLTLLIYLATLPFLLHHLTILYILISIIPALVFGFVLGRPLGKWLYQHFFKSDLFGSQSYKYYLQFKAAEKKFHSQYIRQQRKFWLDLGNLGFESEVELLLKKSGYNVANIRESEEDLISLKIGNDTAVHLVAQQPPLALDGIQKFYDEFRYSNFRNAVVIAKGGFTGKCFKFAKNKSIRLWDLHHLIDLQIQTLN